jgi:hypothetical protein
MLKTDALRARLQRWLSGRPDETILRWLYRTVAIATVVVVALDYGEIEKTLQEKTTGIPATEQPSPTPLPQTPRDGEVRRRAPVPVPQARMKEPMTFELVGDGQLIASGTITPGTAQAFAAEVEKRGSYIKTIRLQSPGGSVQDALAMGRLIRAKNFITEVSAAHYCASSCPLVFAGGVERKAGTKSAIGVHQVFAVGTSLASSADGMENAQQISATAQKYLREMGVDLGVWVHAMETPKDELYYFKPAELIELKLATQIVDAAVAEKTRRKS